MEKFKKIIVRSGLREEEESDYLEWFNATENGDIPEFNDERNIAVKYVVSSDFYDESEETPWYINPQLAEKFIISQGEDYSDTTFSAPFDVNNNVCCIFPEFIPELLLFETPYDIFTIFHAFYDDNMDKVRELSIEEILPMFFKYAKEFMSIEE